MIRVLQIAGSAYGGVEHVIQNYYEHIDRTKVKFDIVYHGDRDRFIEKMENLGCRIYLIKKPAEIGMYKYYRQIYSIIHNNHYNAIHVHPLQYIGLALLAAKHNKIEKRVAHIHNTCVFKNGVKNKLLYYYIKYSILKLTSDIITCSNLAAKSYLGDNDKVSILYNAIDATKYNDSDEEYVDQVKKQLGIKNKKIIGHIGNFVKQKNHKFILDIAENMIQKTEYIFVLAGNGILFENIKMEAKTRKLNNIIFLGYRNDIPKLFKMFDVLILPSLHEGLPVVAVECQIAGVPIIVSNVVTKEVDLGMQMVNYLPTSYASDWREEIIKSIEKIVPSIDFRIQQQKKCGYDINDQTDKLIKLYQERGKQ